MKKLWILVALMVLFSSFFVVKPVEASMDQCGCGCYCECSCDGTGTPGYWKNHPEAWPLEVIDLGGLSFTKEEAIGWMDSPVAKDKSITMFKAVVAARLNWEMGCYDTTAQAWYWEGVSWLNNFPVGSGVKAKSEAWQYSHGELIYWWLDQYNNGLLSCPPRE